MPDPNLVRINNTVYSWSSTRLVINGDPWEGLKAVEYEQKRERKLVHAVDPAGRPKGWTSGKYSVPTLKLKFLKDSAAALKTELAAIGAGSYGDAEWTMILQCTEPVLPPNLPITLTANPCTIIGARESREEGVDELVEEFDVMCLNLLENGLAMWSSARVI